MQKSATHCSYLLLLASFSLLQDDQHAGAAAHHVQPRGEDEGPRDWRDDPPRRHRRGRDGQLQRVGHHDDLHLGCAVEKCSTFLHSLIAISFAAELFSQKGFQSLMKFRWINLFVECSKMFSWSYGIHFRWNGSKLVYPKIYNELYNTEPGATPMKRIFIQNSSESHAPPLLSILFHISSRQCYTSLG